MKLATLIAGLTLAALLALAIGCSVSPAAPTTPTALPSNASPSTATAAQVKSVATAKPVSPSPSGGPRLALDVDLVDFGDVTFGQTVAYSFNVKNVGSAPASLGPAFIRVKEGC